MANWKEIGFVPDSDEEDLLDSQSTANDESVRNDDYIDIEEYDDHNEGKPQDTSAGKASTSSEIDVEPKQDVPTSIYVEAAQVPEVSPDERLGTVLRRSASPEPKLFQFPEGVQKLMGPNVLTNHDAMDLDKAPAGLQNSQLEQSNEDEISKSYVHLQSAASSQLSSPPSSPMSPQTVGLSTLHHGLWSSSPDELAEGHQIETVQGSLKSQAVTSRATASSLDPDALEAPRVRSFRERRPIQLHPYAMEEARYRRTALASGIKPVKVTQYQESLKHRRHHSESQDLEFDTADESQSIREEATQPPSSSLPHSMSQLDIEMINQPNLDASVEDDDDDDDDLPDVNELLRGTQKWRPLKAKQQPATHPPSKLSNPSSRSHVEPLSSQSLAASAEIWDIPSSPPISRSPVRAAKMLLNRPTKDCLISSSSSRRASPLSDVSARNSSPDPITPATSVITTMVDLTRVSDESSDDPFAVSEDSASESEPISEPDESLQLQRVGRRIRGVLPASWLRLDQKTQLPQESVKRHQESGSATPVTTQPKRGVALPVVRRDTRSPRINQDDHRRHIMPFLSDDSDQSDRDMDVGILADNTNIEPSADKHFAPSQADSIQEDDRVDAMLPSRKRQPTSETGQRKPKRLRRSSSLLPSPGNNYRRQSRITEQFSEAPNKEAGRSTKPRVHKVRSRTHKVSRQSQPKPSRLSILDAVPHGVDSGEMPQFLRIAARNARSRRDLGRHSPTKKFIRLANRNDTEDANATLREWRSASIAPSAVVSARRMAYLKGAAKQSIHRSLSGAPTSSLELVSGELHTVANPRGIKKLSISKPRQTNLSFPKIHGSSTTSALTPQEHLQNPVVRKQLQPAPSHAGPARQAQLERLESEYNSRHPVAAFVNTKRNLDALYRRGRKGNTAARGIQLSRFLADDDPMAGSDATGSAVISELHLKESEVQTNMGKKKQLIRRRKGKPIHLDAGAAEFRQPTESVLIENMIACAPLAPDANGSKLLGLGNYGCQYTSHFDILPLDPNVFFHESTFIGSGRLARIIDAATSRDFDKFAGCCSHQLEEKELCWSSWDEQVSSEFGLCFEWLADNLESAAQNNGSADVSKLRAMMDFILRYVQYHMSFLAQNSRQHFVSRVDEVLRCYTERVRALSNESGDHNDPRAQIETTIRVCALLTLVLQISKGDNTLSAHPHQLEVQLQATSSVAMGFLLQLGLGKVREFYEDCQLLSNRETGIRNHLYMVEAWVVLVNLLSVINIPRASFWDIFNSQLLLKEDISSVVDARVLEKMWYAMFSLLPLTRFDAFGILPKKYVERASLENWVLPQRLVKRVFTLYSHGSKQSPSFNEYCRTIFHRCHNLITHWNWDRCGAIIGTLFDFFASHKLAHLRNEESFKSPHFLQELSENPSLSIETGDLCFHILLKIIATAIKRFHHIGDSKSVRNLVTRVLPNHNRQYPKEEPIHISDLASLRNHHDLLSTLFWAAPLESRPSLTLLRDLVVPERSHKEACLIHLEAWENLGSFIFVNEPHTSASKEIIDWHTSFVSSFIAERQAVQDSLDRLLEGLAAADADNPFNEANIRNIANSNIDSATEMIAHATKRAYKMCAIVTSFQEHKNFFEAQLLNAQMIMRRYSKELPASCYFDILVQLKVVDQYIDRINTHIPLTSAASTEEDSQDYGGEEIYNMAQRQWAAQPLKMSLVYEYGSMMSKTLEDLTASDLATNDSSESLASSAVHSWAKLLACLLTSNHCEVVDIFGENGKYNQFVPSARFAGVEPYFVIYFLNSLKLIGQFDLFDRMKEIGLEITTVLFRNLASDKECWSVTDRLIVAILNHHERHFLINDDELRIPNPAPAAPNLTQLLLRDHQGGDSWRLVTMERLDHRLDFFEVLLKKMRHQLQALQVGVSLENLFRRLLKCVATHIERYLVTAGSTQPSESTDEAANVARRGDSTDLAKYVDSASNLISLMMRLTNHIYSVDRLATSITPYVEDSKAYEQRYFQDKLASYSRTTKVAVVNHALLYYCLGSYHVAATNANSLKIMSHDIAKAMVAGFESNINGAYVNIVDDSNRQSDQFRLAVFLLAQLLPALIHTAYHGETGWTLTELYLMAARDAVEIIGCIDDVTLMCALIPVLKTAIDGITHVQLQNLENAQPANADRMKITGHKIVTIAIINLFTTALPHILDGVDLARKISTSQSSASITEQLMSTFQSVISHIKEGSPRLSTGFQVDLSSRMSPFQQLWGDYASIIIGDFIKKPPKERDLLLNEVNKSNQHLNGASFEFLELFEKLRSKGYWMQKRRAGGYFSGVTL